MPPKMENQCQSAQMCSKILKIKRHNQDIHWSGCEDKTQVNEVHEGECVQNLKPNEQQEAPSQVITNDAQQTSTNVETHQNQGDGHIGFIVIV